MKASLRSVRIAPKKANIIAKMIRGAKVEEALGVLERTNKKAARMIEGLIKSAVANAAQNDKQDPKDLVIKTITVNKAQSYHRGYPIARGRYRSLRKFLSHIDITLGVADEVDGSTEEKSPKRPKSPRSPKSESPEKASQKVEKTVKKEAASGKSSPKTKSTKGKSEKSDTATPDSPSSVSTSGEAPSGAKTDSPKS